MTLRGKPVALFKLGFIALLLLIYCLALLPNRNVSAAQITSRTLTLQSGASDGGSKPSGVVKHQFTFTLPNAGGGNVGSIKFLYCTTPDGPSNPSCTTPAGLSTTSATLTNQLGATGFSIVNATNGAPYITRTAAGITAGTAVTYQLSTVTNPSGTSCGGSSPQNQNCTFYVRISTYASTDTTGSAIDTGTVAASTAQQITLSGYMPESLIFCTGGNITTTSGVPDCSTATSGSISFNQSFSPSDTATALSKMAASTNADSGYNITYSGATLTSGSNTVAPMTSSTTGVRGTSQFGLNVVANTTATSTVAVGSNVAPANNGSNYRGAPATGYGTADNFKFTTSGDTVAKSDNGTGSFGPTDIQIYTVSYIVNANGAQAVGTYTTTLTYVCTATY
jgi:hypothetical protein